MYQKTFLLNNLRIYELTGVFFDEASKKLSKQIPSSVNSLSKVMLNIEQFSIGQSYVTASIRNRFGDVVNINIEGGRSGLDIQKSLFNIVDIEPKYAYVRVLLLDGRILIRKLPILGEKDWLLIYEDSLFLLAVKDAYNEIEIFLI